MQILKKIKNTTLTFLELIQIRLEMARIELIEQKNFLIKLFCLVSLSFIFLLVSFISLLFGLNSILEPSQKSAVFFSISAVMLVIILIFLFSIRNILKRQRNFMNTTLTEMKYDIQALKHSLKKNSDNSLSDRQELL